MNHIIAAAIVAGAIVFAAIQIRPVEGNVQRVLVQSTHPFNLQQISPICSIWEGSEGYEVRTFDRVAKVLKRLPGCEVNRPGSIYKDLPGPGPERIDVLIVQFDSGETVAMYESSALPMD